MKRTLLATAAAVLALTPGIADARCSLRDLAGAWDLYFTTATIAQQCEMQILSDGMVDGGCITFFDSQDSDGTVFTGQLRLVGTCNLTGELDIQNMSSPCGVDGTMHQRIGMVGGVLHCGFEGNNTALAALFTMLKQRPARSTAER